MKAKWIILLKVVLRAFLPSEQSYHYAAIVTEMITREIIDCVINDI